MSVQRVCQQLHRMNNLEVQTGALCAISELKHAARIACSEHLNTSFLNLFHLCIQYCHRDFRLRDVVDPGASAALIGARYLHQIDAWNRIWAFFKKNLNPDKGK